MNNKSIQLYVSRKTCNKFHTVKFMLLYFYSYIVPESLCCYHLYFNMRCILLCLIYFGTSESKLWPKGVVHYAINPKDYDIHSQDEIVSAFSAIEKEICVKFFSTPVNYNTSDAQKVLYINNPDKRKNCPPQYYNYTGSVVNMAIGYKCINMKDIARMAIEMLKASIQQSTSPINSFDLVKRFEEQDEAKTRPTFLTTADRNYINAHYHKECSMLSARAEDYSVRRSNDLGSTGLALSPANEEFYRPRAWPLGLVMYSVDEKLQATDGYRALLHAMTQVELGTCIVFHETDKLAFKPNNVLVFSEEGSDEPELGFKEGQQVLSLEAFMRGAPGHNAHALNNLMRVLGIPMMSNRYDRDNYLSVQWSRVQKGKEHLLEKSPKDAWVTGIPYDFGSVTHAPTNYLCGSCQPGEATVQPFQDFLWKRSLEMGHHGQLSDSDKTLLNLVYSEQCKTRFVHGRQ